MQTYRKSLLIYLTLLAVAAGRPSTALGHFVWLGVKSDDGGKQSAHVWFGESAAPGEGHLIEKIAATSVWAIAEDGTQTKLQPTVVVADDEGALIAPLKKPPARLAAEIDYGVIERDGQPFMLKYYARHIASTPEGLASVSKDRRLPVDIDAQLKNGRLHLTVLADGKPRPDAEIVAYLPKGKEFETKTDEQGQAIIDAKQAGFYDIRAKVVDKRNGEFNGKKYAEVRQYATLSLRVHAPESAAGLLDGARRARAIWNNFSGFTADATIFAEGKSQTGRITVSSTGDVELKGFDLKEKDVQRTLGSMMSHRLGGASDSDDVSLVNEAAKHPLGPLVKLDYDTAMGSTYRIRDNVIRQVNREMGGGHFTISVLDVAWNKEGEYLPAVYTVTFWNKDGSVRRSSTVRDQWKRIGGMDLPTQHLTVTAGANKLDYINMEFSNHQLLSAE